MSIWTYSEFQFGTQLDYIWSKLPVKLKFKSVQMPENNTPHGTAICKANVKVFDVVDVDMRRKIKQVFIEEGWICLLDDMHGSGKRMVFEPHPLPGFAKDWYLKTLMLIHAS